MIEILPDSLSPLDRAIIARLQQDGRTPFSTMAADFGFSEATVQRRTQQLVDDGYFKIIGVVDPFFSLSSQAVLIGLGVETADIHSTAAKVSVIPEVRFASLTTGAFDLICEIVAFDRATLIEILTRTLSAIPGIRSVNTSWVLANYKTNYLWDREASEAWPSQSPSVTEVSDFLASLSGAQPPIQLDELDDAIVQILRERGRISYADLAAEVGATLSTARRRTIRLLESGYMRVVAVGDPFRLGFHYVVMLWIKVDIARIKDVLVRLAREDAIRYLSRVAGTADIVAEALLSRRSDLLNFLDGPLASIEGIREIAVSFELRIHKRAYVCFD